MADSPSPAENHSVPRPRRTKLADFPCPRWTPYQRHHCEPNLAWCGLDGECELEQVYRKYLALQRCARVLLAIKRWWWDKHYWPDIFTGESGDPGAVRVVRFRNWMTAALRKAGLL